jgi:hypothetical protein
MKHRAITLAVAAAFALPALAAAQELSDQALARVAGGEIKAELRDDAAAAVAAQALATGLAATPAQISDPRPVPTPGLAIGTGGVIATGPASVKMTNSGLVHLTDKAQEEVRGVNVTNAAESIVGNGVNVWAGRLADQAANGLVPLIVNSTFQFDQQNAIGQSQARSASLGESAHFQTNVDTLDKASASINGTANVTKGNTSVDVLFGAVTYSSDKGRGLAAAGDATLEVDAGKVSINPNVSITTTASAVFGLIEGEVSSQASMPITFDLPELRLDVNAAACVADDGASCSATRNDSASSEKSSTIASAPTSKVANARAEYILIGGGDLTVDAKNEVILANDAQRAARGVNIVNAASSVVGNGVNIAAMSGLSAAAGFNLRVDQSNLLIQAR